jgi:hypothetical protein
MRLRGDERVSALAPVVDSDEEPPALGTDAGDPAGDAPSAEPPAAGE